MSCPETPHLLLQWFEMDVKMMFGNIIIKHSPPSYCKTQDASHRRTSMVGSYSSTKWFWISWMVSALLPTPPAPTTTSLYSVMFVAAARHTLAQFLQRKQRGGQSDGLVSCMERSFITDTSKVMRTFERLCVHVLLVHSWG